MLNECYFPIAIKPNYKVSSSTNLESLKVGCGKCLYCRRKRSRDWIFRLLAEQKNSLNAYFLTLTYDDENIPFTDTGLPTLDKKDFQKFMKRLRHHNKLPLKYYAVGEYGGRTQRPHYHAIMFNITDIDYIAKDWKKGLVSVDDCSSSSIAYVTGYVNKYRLEKHEDDDRELEFNLISRGIGASLVTENMRDYVYRSKSDVWQMNGDKYTLPRYLKDKLDLDDSIKYELLLKKQEFHLATNALSRDELRALYQERLRSIRLQKQEQFLKLKI